MLPQKNRLRKEKDFRRVLKEGQSIRASGLALKFLKNRASFPRFGIVVSKSIDKRAVKRNYIKRFITETIRKELHAPLLGMDAVIIGEHRQAPVTGAVFKTSAGDSNNHSFLYELFY